MSKNKQQRPLTENKLNLFKRIFLHFLKEEKVYNLFFSNFNNRFYLRDTYSAIDFDTYISIFNRNCSLHNVIVCAFPWELTDQENTWESLAYKFSLLCYENKLWEKLSVETIHREFRDVINGVEVKWTITYGA